MDTSDVKRLEREFNALSEQIGTVPIMVPTPEEKANIQAQCDIVGLIETEGLELEYDEEKGRWIIV
jgi:hypothetical protein